MPTLTIQSPSEQVAAHLREELARGRWTGTMPGGPALAAELGLDGKTVWAAMQLLEHEGVLVGQGAGRPRKIAPASAGRKGRGLRVAILAGERRDLRLDYMVELQHQLTEAGNVAFHPPATLDKLGMDVSRVARLVKRTKADAWIVMAASREVLAWFAKRGIPTFAIFGRRRGLPLAGVGPDKPPAFAALTRRLCQLGHRRIAMFVRPMRRLPNPGASEALFLETLKEQGIATGPYNLPDWEESKEGFHDCLDSHFRHTPPTALIIDESPLLVAVLQFCAERGIRVPDDLSVVCSDPDPAFDWCSREIAHIRWDHRPIVTRTIKWANAVARGKEDRRQTVIKAEFVEGGTIGPAR